MVWYYYYSTTESYGKAHDGKERCTDKKHNNDSNRRPNFLLIITIF